MWLSDRNKKSKDELERRRNELAQKYYHQDYKDLCSIRKNNVDDLIRKEEEGK